MVALSVQRVVLCSGKHYYALLKQREASAANQNTALVRVEELCPFPLAALQQELNKYPNAKGNVATCTDPQLLSGRLGQKKTHIGPETG